MSASDRYDAVIIGAGPAGETVVAGLVEQGLRVALCERELIGGECAYWACIPSKTLLRPPEAQHDAQRAAGLARPDMDWGAVAGYRDEIVRHLDDSAQASEYADQGVAVFRGEARLAGPGRVEVAGQTLETDRVVLATGSAANVPPIDGLDRVPYWTNREVTTMEEVPQTAVVLGGGPVGVEFAQLLRRHGAFVHLVESNPSLLHNEDPRVGELVESHLQGEYVDVRTGHQAQSVAPEGDQVRVTLDDGEEVAGERLVVAIGRRPRVEGLGLDTVGIDASSGAIPVDERCRAADGLWAIGDVTGAMPFTHVGMYHGRVVVADIAGEDVRVDLTGVPRVVFADPEVAAVGLTEAQAREQGLSVATARVDLAASTARAVTYEPDPRGELGLVADTDRGVLVGAWIVGPMASEWIHHPALAIKAGVPLAVLRDSVAQFPTFMEGLLTGIRQL